MINSQYSVLQYESACKYINVMMLDSYVLSENKWLW